MAWYDVFSRFYDTAIESHYREQRAAAAEALDLRPGSVVLDAPCGTGQSFPAFRAAMGDEGTILGADLSPGMLREAQRRVAAAGWSHVHPLRADAGALTLGALREAAGRDVRPDRLHVFLGMSVFPDPDAVFANLWSLLADGGRCVIVDVFAERPGLQGRMVEVVARADIRRRFWEPLERMGRSFEHRSLPTRAEHGGTISLATATKG